MIYNKNPSIIQTSPKNHQTDVPLNAQIYILFDTDIDELSLINNIYMYDYNGTEIEIKYKYFERLLTIVPTKLLNVLETYNILIQSDGNISSSNKSIRSVIGTYMLENYNFVFTTKDSSISSTIISNGIPNNVILNSQPVFKYTVNNLISEDIIVEIQLSKTEVFDNLIWSSNFTLNDGKSGIKPNIILSDGIYYWRARINNGNDDFGKWSETYTFNLSTLPLSSITPEDKVLNDFNSNNLIFTYPQRSNVSIKNKLIAITIESIIPIEQIEEDNIYIDCYSNDDNEVGNSVDIEKIDIVYNEYDNTTTIILELKSLI